ncbi:MAG TPA: patatin-like phospholipase family protein [Longimicrobiales bacterium]
MSRSHPRKRTAALVAAALAMQVAPARAQSALVLGGGGARGLAHAGVVVALERLGREPDMVVGTSMGAIIGALYAAGIEPARIWRLIETQDWPTLFTPAPLVVGPDREPRYPVLEITLDPGRRPRARGLISDWRINRTLVRLLFDAQARSRGDFDRLPRRFRAVATDLRDGAIAAPATGDLARAVRASMAVPGVFAPVRWNARLLVDGGISNYLPVAVARGLGAKHVIAVDVLRPPARIESLDPLSIGLRGLRLTLLNTLPDEVRPDVLILPEIEPGLPEAVFPRNPLPLLRAGLDATLAALAPAPRPAPERRPQPPPDSLGRLRIGATDPALAALAEAAFAPAAPAPYDTGRVLAAVDRLYRTGLFTGIWPSVLSEPDATLDATADPSPELHVELDARPPVRLAAAAGYDTDRGGRAWAAIDARLPVDVPTSIELAATGQSIERWVAAATHVMPPTWAPIAWTAGTHYRERDVRLFRDDHVVDELEVRRTGGWLGLDTRRITPDAVISATFRAEHVDVDHQADGGAFGPLLRFAEAGPLTRVVGIPTIAEAEIRFGAFDYRRAHLGAALETHRGPVRFAVLADIAAARGNAPPDALPALGDQHLIPGLRWGAERGRTRAVLGADIAIPIPLEGMARLRIRGGAIGDDFAQFDDDEHWLAGADAGALWTTPLGPILLAAGIDTRRDWRLDVSVGPAF